MTDVRFEWSDHGNAVMKVSDIPEGAETAFFYRERQSHRGIRSRQALRYLRAGAVNQDFLDEICALSRLEDLYLTEVQATDLSGLKRLTHLRHLTIISVRKIEDFCPTVAIPSLRSLSVENPKLLRDLSFLENAHHLHSISVEGGMYEVLKLPSLKPLFGLRGLEVLNLTSVQLKDTSLSGLAECPKLRKLHCARFAPETEFLKLRGLMPHLECQWCDDYEISFDVS